MAALNKKNQPLILTKTAQDVPTGRKRQRGILVGSHAVRRGFDLPRARRPIIPKQYEQR
jgi:hypothetical protein